MLKRRSIENGKNEVLRGFRTATGIKQYRNNPLNLPVTSSPHTKRMYATNPLRIFVVVITDWKKIVPS